MTIDELKTQIENEVKKSKCTKLRSTKLGRLDTSNDVISEIKRLETLGVNAPQLMLLLARLLVKLLEKELENAKESDKECLEKKLVEANERLKKAEVDSLKEGGKTSKKVKNKPGNQTSSLP